MRGFARLGDRTTGHCSAHYPGGHTVLGIVIGTSSNVLVNGIPQSRLGDIVLADCGSIGIINTGSQKVLVNGVPAGRLGDTFSGTYSGTIITSASKMLCV